MTSRYYFTTVSCFANYITFTILLTTDLSIDYSCYAFIG